MFAEIPKKNMYVCGGCMGPGTKVKVLSLLADILLVSQEMNSCIYPSKFSESLSSLKNSTTLSICCSLLHFQGTRCLI